MPTIPVNARLPFWLKEPLPSALAICVCAGVLLFLAGSPLAGFDRQWTDLMLRMRSTLGLSPHPDEKVFLVGFEERDYESVPDTGAEYKNYADLIRMSSDLGAAVVALDFILGRGGAVESAPVIASASGARGVVFAAAILARGPAGQTSYRSEDRSQDRSAEMLRAFPFGPPRFPYGLVNTATDSDGVHRDYIYARKEGNTCHPSLALAEYLVWREALADLQCPSPDEAVWKELASDQSSLVERRIRIRTRINYRSAFVEPWSKGFKYTGFSDLRKKYERWKQSPGIAVPGDIPGPGSLVLAGAVAPGLGDLGATPFGASEPLFILHANALSDLVQDRTLRTATRVASALFALGAAVFFVFVTFRIRIVKLELLAWIVCLSLLTVLSATALIKYDFVLPAVTPGVLVTMLFLADAGRRYSLVSLEKIHLRSNLGLYFSPRVLEAVLAQPGIMEPREAELTVLITDLRNFTTITEQMGTPAMFELLNRIFEVETKAVMDMDGSMEHFLGDQFLGYWGAPQEQPDAADRAMHAADAILTGLEELRGTLSPEMTKLFGFGLAIHKGKALIGNKGSRYRLDYGILGDIVNAAARLESLTKVYGVRQIVTREVLDALRAMPVHRLIDRVGVKGKTRPLEMFEVFPENSPRVAELCSRYFEAFELYTSGAFSDAAASFDRLAADYSDGPSKALAKRSRELAEAQPPDWDGVFRFKEK